MPIITLLSDLGTADHYVALVKGKLYTGIPGVTLVDISHQVLKHDLVRTAFLLRQTWHAFPEGSIHIIGVDALETPHSALIAVAYKGHYFLGSDNGVFSQILDHEPEMLVHLKPSNPGHISPFPMLTDLVPAAIALANGTPIQKLGIARSGYLQMAAPAAFERPNQLQATIMYIDSFGNLITNVDKPTFERFVGDAAFYLDVPGTRRSLNRIAESYLSETNGVPIAVFGHTGLLEVAIVRGSAAKMLGLGIHKSFPIVTDAATNR